MSDDARVLTFTEQARREQLIAVTIHLVAEHGYAGTSLSGIAEGAGITKAAVLYHFGSKDAVVDAASAHVLDALVSRVGGAVESAAPAAAPAVYVRTMIDHLQQNPEHIRMIIEAATNQPQDIDRSSRWRDLAATMTAARRARGLDAGGPWRTLAITVGGGIDAIVAERLVDPDYDTAEAAEELVGIMERTLFA